MKKITSLLVLCLTLFSSCSKQEIKEISKEKALKIARKSQSMHFENFNNINILSFSEEITTLVEEDTHKEISNIEYRKDENDYKIESSLFINDVLSTSIDYHVFYDNGYFVKGFFEDGYIEITKETYDEAVNYIINIVDQYMREAYALLTIIAMSDYDNIYYSSGDGNLVTEVTDEVGVTHKFEINNYMINYYEKNDFINNNFTRQTYIYEMVEEVE